MTHIHLAVNEGTGLGISKLLVAKYGPIVQ